MTTKPPPSEAPTTAITLAPPTVATDPEPPTVVLTSEPPTAALPTESAPAGDGAAPMLTKVRIDSPGVTVEIEAHESLDNVVTTALRMFHEAGGWPQDTSRATGFAQVERRDTPPAQASSMPHSPGAYPVQLP